MTTVEMALTIAFFGGISLAVAIGALAAYFRARLHPLEGWHEHASHERRIALEQLATIREITGRAMISAEHGLDVQRITLRQVEAARILRASTERRRKIVALRAARARGGRKR